MTSPAEQTILLTGASGFVAAHILDKFLSKGYNVRGTVRSESSIPAIRKATNPQYHDKLSFAIVPDMQDPHAFDEAVQGVNGILHSASPFVLQSKDNAREILDPAINGTLNVLKAAAASKNPQLKRVIITSSFAAIVDLDQGYRPGYKYSEKDWNPATYETAAKNPSAFAYCASKGLAERAAWDFVEKEKPQFSLTTICPPWIIGPNINTITSLNKLNESTQIIYNLINGSLTAPPPTDFAGYADVRDVAEAHLLAYETPAAAGERFLVAAGNWSYQTACDIIRAEFPELKDKVPVGTPGAGEKEDVYRLDNSKIQSVLGLRFRSTKETLTDTVKTLLRLEKELN
ncbi:cinnamoyl-CoA reductase, putative [Paecilomyces variotii No. 5]|uniref:Cinnamoyl-CoA reductase, putative n=1 Tax=Byssochlamys spectabilis (strain No. 5 / NBRC 109023) TaxID=1356009 RepID=V5FUF2_BYSSN|nr:cinnamoyl-CoA reductase, putative [Paecilomyces variotii No. 5]